MGRPNGSPNKQPITFKRIREALEKTGHDPLLTQIRFAMGDNEALKLAPGTITPAMRKSANEFILERMYPTLKAVDMQVSDGAPFQVQVINFASIPEGKVALAPSTAMGAQGPATKEIEHRSSSPNRNNEPAEVEFPTADPLRVLRRRGEAPISDDLSKADGGETPFGTVIGPRKP